LEDLYYGLQQAKAIDIYNLNIRYLQRLITNVIFGRHDSQNMCRKAELFLIWCVLLGTRANTRAFIICHLLQVTKTIYENVIGVGKM